MRKSTPITILALLVGLAAGGAPDAALARGDVDCEMRFAMKGWSLFYKTAKGTGTITCDNGQRMNVSVRARGGGLTVGKSTIDDGIGEFSGVHQISDVLGTYIAAEAHAGASKSTKAQAMTKGEVSLAIAGTGHGWDVGVAIGRFVIRRR